MFAVPQSRPPHLETRSAAALSREMTARRRPIGAAPAAG